MIDMREKLVDYCKDKGIVLSEDEKKYDLYDPSTLKHLYLKKDDRLVYAAYQMVIDSWYAEYHPTASEWGDS